MTGSARSVILKIEPDTGNHRLTILRFTFCIPDIFDKSDFIQKLLPFVIACYIS
jgi:hypothetical protein